MLYRFSKLFMTHLDAEFKKQNSESLKTLITNQVMFPALPYCIWLTFPKFQGTQVYGTICQSCQYRSETRSEFLELEVSFKVSTYRNFNYYYSPKSCKNNAKLEDCISTSLLPETLSGENQWGLIPQVRTLLYSLSEIRYLCSGCRSLQNATRYTELRKFPPVLHFSLMRFVYDLNTMERKKSKHSISFPLSLDMNRFLGSPEDRRHATSTTCDDNIYELRGILLHKGASAYHGHYEAQVYDAQWIILPCIASFR
jgi:ubiquitin carboxyl-terminal hydrolase 48